MPKHAQASVAGRVASRPPLAAVRRWAEKAAPACPRKQRNKQNSNAAYATYSGRTVGRGEKPGGAEERHKRRPRPRRRTLHGAATVGRASRAVQPVRQCAWALARCVFVRAGGWACSGKGWGATREGEEGEVTRSSSYISDPSVTSCNPAKPAVTQRPRLTRPYQMASPHLRRDRPTAHICAGLAGVIPTAALGPHR